MIMTVQGVLGCDVNLTQCKIFVVVVQLFIRFAEVSVAIFPVSQNTSYNTDHCIHQITSHPPSRPAIMSEPMAREHRGLKGHGTENCLQHCFGSVPEMHQLSTFHKQ